MPKARFQRDVAHRDLLAGILADLAAQHAYGIAPLLESAVVPALDGGEAEADGVAAGGVMPLMQLISR